MSTGYAIGQPAEALRPDFSRGAQLPDSRTAHRDDLRPFLTEPRSLRTGQVFMCDVETSASYSDSQRDYLRDVMRPVRAEQALREAEQQGWFAAWLDRYALFVGAVIGAGIVLLVLRILEKW